MNQYQYPTNQNSTQRSCNVDECRNPRVSLFLNLHLKWKVIFFPPLDAPLCAAELNFTPPYAMCARVRYISFQFLSHWLVCHARRRLDYNLPRQPKETFKGDHWAGGLRDKPEMSYVFISSKWNVHGGLLLKDFHRQSSVKSNLGQSFASLNVV